MSKHTPGPWDYYFEPSDHYKHKIRSKPGLICQLPGWVTHDELRLEQEANARLIAAAPDHHAVALELDRLMLVIESAVRQHDPSHSKAVVAMLKANRATIAKATGEHHD